MIFLVHHKLWFWTSYLRKLEAGLLFDWLLVLDFKWFSKISIFQTWISKLDLSQASARRFLHLGIISRVFQLRKITWIGELAYHKAKFRIFNFFTLNFPFLRKNHKNDNKGGFPDLRDFILYMIFKILHENSLYRISLFQENRGSHI